MLQGSSVLTQPACVCVGAALTCVGADGAALTCVGADRAALAGYRDGVEAVDATVVVDAVDLARLAATLDTLALAPPAAVLALTALVVHAA